MAVQTETIRLDQVTRVFPVDLHHGPKEHQRKERVWQSQKGRKRSEETADCRFGKGSITALVCSVARRSHTRRNARRRTRGLKAQSRPRKRRKKRKSAVLNLLAKRRMHGCLQRKRKHPQPRQRLRPKPEQRRLSSQQDQVLSLLAVVLGVKAAVWPQERLRAMQLRASIMRSTCWRS